MLKIKLIILTILIGIILTGCNYKHNYINEEETLKYNFVETPNNIKEDEIVSYLEKKYNSKFKIIKLIDKRRKVSRYPFSVDGELFFPGKYEKGAYCYTYIVKSLSINKTFKIQYIDRGKKRMKRNEIIETDDYKGMKEKIKESKKRRRINNYIIQVFKPYNAKIVNETIKIDKSLNDLILDTKHMELIEKINFYIKEQEADIYIFEIEYKNKYSINFQCKNEHTILIIDDKSNQVIKYNEYINNKHNREEFIIYERKD